MSKKKYTEELFIDDRPEEVAEEREIPPEVLEAVKRHAAENNRKYELAQKDKQQSKHN